MKSDKYTIKIVDPDGTCYLHASSMSEVYDILQEYFETRECVYGFYINVKYGD